MAEPLHPCDHAREAPDRPAYIMVETGETVTYRELDDRSNQGAHLLRSLGLKRGDAVMFHLENHPRFLELCWAAQRAGLYYTPVSSRLAAEEIAYIAGDLKPGAFFTSRKLSGTAKEAGMHEFDGCTAFCVDGDDGPFADYLAARDQLPMTPITDESPGIDLLYSSGTTGRPKGVKLELPEGPIQYLEKRWQAYHTVMGFDKGSVHFVPSPLYHALPLHHAMVAHNYGGTVLVIQRFDAEQALAAIEKYKVTQASWVATMFIRMLKLPEEVRKSYDISSMQAMVHGAGPTPVPVKEAIIDWFGPIVYEAYASTEGFGGTTITSQEWLNHKGSVGRPIMGAAHIVDEETGKELPPGEVGTIYFENPRKVEYLNDRDKTASVFLENGWATAGDIGYLDEDGYLYLTDRKADMIISGGVNIYPQEIEAALIVHPKIADVAIFGIPNDEFGEEVKAVIQPISMDQAGDGLEREIIDFCKTKLSALKAPRSVDFLEELPRHETGKLYKRLLREPYWQEQAKSIN